VVLKRPGRWSAVCIATAIAASVTCSRTHTAGFWFEHDAVSLPNYLAAQVDGPLTEAEIASIERLSRAEVERAFDGLTVSVVDSDRAFWRVAVLRSLPERDNKALPHAGESLAMGFLGGRGSVGFDFVAFQAAHYAPPGARRADIIAGIGRGVGRVAVHEFMHQMLGLSNAHDDTDVNSYEYGRPDRSSQYYGDLHWTTALPLLRRKLGARRDE